MKSYKLYFILMLVSFTIFGFRMFNEHDFVGGILCIVGNVLCVGFWETLDLLNKIKDK